jgi:UDP-glucose 4-epimerase
MNYLVTGGAGFIGSHLVDRLISLGNNVTVIDNEHSKVHDQFYWNEKAKNYKLDIRDYKNTRKLYDGIDCVFHLAAESRIQPAIQNPIESISINSIGTATVLECSKEAGVKRVIYSSTSSSYGKNPVPNHEEQPDDCLNHYSVSKVNGEKLCSMYTDLFGIETIIFRYFNVYGERQPLKGEFAPVVGLFMKQFDDGQPLTVVGNGNQKRDFTHVSDVVEANILASQVKSGFGEVYNIGFGKNYSIIDIAKMISNDIVFIPARIGESEETLASYTKFNTLTGWEPKVSLTEWLKK